jgi:hypothetical protein
MVGKIVIDKYGGNKTRNKLNWVKKMEWTRNRL